MCTLQVQYRRAGSAGLVVRQRLGRVCAACTALANRDTVHPEP